MVGYCYSGTNKGVVVSRASAQLADKMVISWAPSNDVVVLDTGSNFACYDIWTETSKPELFLGNENGVKYLFISLPGRCSGIYKIKLPDVADKFNTISGTVNFQFPDTLKDLKITSTVYDNLFHRITFAAKKFNSVESKLYSFDSISMNSNTGKETTLRYNEALPILAQNPWGAITGYVYVAFSGFSEVIRYSKDLEISGIAVLPPQLKAVSSILFTNDSLYMVTNEPNTEIGRLSKDNFCNDFCSAYGYCDGAKNECACIPNYAKDPSVSDKFVCAPTHIIDYQTQLVTETAAAAAFGVLFAIAMIAGIAGWFLWYRGRKISMI